MKPDSAERFEQASATDQLDKLEVTGSSPVTPIFLQIDGFGETPRTSHSCLEVVCHPRSPEPGANR